MRASALVFLLSLFAASASAQQAPHPCDVTAPANPMIVSTTVVIGFCHSGKDAKGNATTLTAFKIAVDGAVVLTWTGPLTPTSKAPNAAGFSYYEAPAVPVGRGTHTVTASAVDVDGESAMSTAFQFGTKGPGPSLVLGVRVR